MTDFEEHGYSRGPIPIEGQHWLLTIDFEAFNAQSIGNWLRPMETWAEEAARSGFRCCFFMSIEDVVNLREQSASAYRDFLDRVNLLYQSGVRFYPHNHSIFDPETGAFPPDPDIAPPAGYTKRPSMFYRAHYLHGVDFGVWMATVRSSYERFLDDAGLPLPEMLAFRAGGWDYGSSSDDLRVYTEALRYAGYRTDSSACTGAFGTESWRMGGEYQSNVFSLDPGLIEVAPNVALDCGRDEQGASPFGESHGSGVFVHVLHFDHLFHELRDGTYDYFGVTDPDQVDKRIERFFRTIGGWRTPNLESSTFEDIASELVSDQSAVPVMRS